jgi:hypothetical protein
MKSFVKVWLGVAMIAIGIGIVILIITFSAGVSFDDFAYNRMSFTSGNIPNYSLQESYTGVENIDFNIQYGNVKIVKGNTFSIDAEHFPEDGIKSYVSNGTWYIEDEKTDEEVHFFGIDVPLRDFYGWDGYSPKATITIPEGFKAGSYNMVIGAGKITAEEIKAQDGYLEVSAGSITVDKIEIDGNSKYYADAGQIKVEQANIKDITVDCSVGEIVIEGNVTGDNDITCDVGKVRLNLSGMEEDYSYDVNADIGEVEINDHQYQGISNEVIDNNGADNNLSLSCDIGSITVDFY